MENLRNDYIDIAKGIGIALVILGHLVYAEGKISIFIFAFHMPLFYFLSGYVCAPNVNRIKYLKRVANLLIAYVLVAITGAVISFAIPSYRDDLNIIKICYDVIYNTQPECLHVGQIWFLISMIWCLSIFYFIHFLFDKTFWTFIVSFFVFLLSCIVSILKIQLYVPDIRGGYFLISHLKYCLVCRLFSF